MDLAMADKSEKIAACRQTRPGRYGCLGEISRPSNGLVRKQKCILCASVHEPEPAPLLLAPLNNASTGCGSELDPHPTKSPKASPGDLAGCRALAQGAPSSSASDRLPAGV